MYLEYLRDLFRELRDNAKQWCTGKSPWIRAIFTLYLVYAFIRHLADPLYRSWFAGITLIFHEMGHMAFVLFGRTMTILGGSIMQLLIPTLAAFYLLIRQRDWFGFAVGFFWLSFSTFELSTYVDDANKELLPLISMGGTPEHDWSTLLTQWHLLNQAQTLAFLLRVIASLQSLGALALSLWLFYQMVKPPNDVYELPTE